MDIETTQEIILEQLTADTVNVKKAEYADINGTKTQIGGYVRSAYFNCEIGREQVKADLPESYANAIFAVWGEEATASDPEQKEE